MDLLSMEKFLGKRKPLAYNARWLLTAWGRDFHWRSREIKLRNSEGQARREFDKQAVTRHLSYMSWEERNWHLSLIAGYITQIMEQDISVKCRGLSDIGLSCRNYKWKKKFFVYAFSKH